MTTSSAIRVSVDVGCHRHRVAVGLPSGQVLDEFEVAHRPEGFTRFFNRIDQLQQRYGGAVSVAMEGYNGWARPLDTLVRSHGYKLFNINNLKLARFKEIFPAAAKSDRIDARKGLELFQLWVMKHWVMKHGVRSFLLPTLPFPARFHPWPDRYALNSPAPCTTSPRVGMGRKTFFGETTTGNGS